VDTAMPFELIDKPAGVPGDRDGFSQFISQRRAQPLFAVNDLDYDISGAVMVTETAQVCEQLRQRMAGGGSRTVFRFVTDQPAPRTQKKPGPHRLRRCDGIPFQGTKYSVWETATLGFADTQRLRKEASEAGVAILGDTAHGGSPFPRLMLHCVEMRFDADAADGDLRPPYRVPPPFVFDCPQQFDRADLINWLVCIERRQRSFAVKAETTLRLIHSDGGLLRCDRLGSVCWFYWYGEEAPTAAQLEEVSTVAAVAGVSQWRLQWMFDRGRDPHHKQLWGNGAGESQWTGEENGVRYLFREAQGLSPGLFLDQRHNRRWVMEHARDQRVLNLFSYTGGFGLCAAAGAAAEVVNVDSSRNTQEWARENFLLNGFALTDVEFSVTDARLFVQGCARRGRQFDLIVCDPPSFARCQDGVFQLERHLPELLRDLLEIAAPGAAIVVSTNYEKWSFAEFRRVVIDSVRQRTQVLPMPSPDWDFEVPGQVAEPILKSLCLRVNQVG